MNETLSAEQMIEKGMEKELMDHVRERLLKLDGKPFYISDYPDIPGRYVHLVGSRLGYMK